MDLDSDAADAPQDGTTLAALRSLHPSRGASSHDFCNMAGNQHHLQSPMASATPDARRQKLPKLPQSALQTCERGIEDAGLISQPDAKISKRVLTRQPITNKASQHREQIIYVSSATPFMSAIKRVRKHITQIQKRRAQSVAAVSSKRGSEPLHKAKGDRILAAAIESLDRQDAAALVSRGGKDEVLVKGTGKAIEKVLAVAGWLQDRAAQEGVRVRLETGSWWAVDDVELEEAASGDNMELDGEVQGINSKQAEEVPDTRTRSLSVLTVRVVVL